LLRPLDRLEQILNILASTVWISMNGAECFSRGCLSRPKNPEQIIRQALLEISAKAQHGSEVTTQAGAHRDSNPNSLQSFSELALNLSGGDW
jgi:hypothetical protein